VTALLVSYVLVAAAQIISYGRLAPHALVLVLLGVGAGAWGAFSGRRDASTASTPALVLGVAALILAAMAQNPLTYCRVAWWPAAYLWSLLLALGLVASYLADPGAAAPRWRAARFALLLLLVVGGRIAVPLLSPTPGEDVWVVQQEAAAAALAGADPYSVAYSQIFSPETYEQFGYRSGFHYPPIALVPIVPAYALVGDVRWAYVVCELLLLAALWAWGGAGARGERRAGRELAVLLWGFNTSALFILEHSWNEPAGLALLAGFLLASRRGRAWPAAVCLAAFFSWKQYTLLLFPLLLFLPSPGPVLVGFAALTAITYAPWIVTGPGGLVASLMEPWRAHPRPDALSLAALWLNVRQMTMPQWISALCLIGAMQVATARIARDPRGLLLALWTILAALFLTAKQSFCNYYYLMSYLTLAAALLEGEAAAPRADAARPASPGPWTDR